MDIGDWCALEWHFCDGHGCGGAVFEPGGRDTWNEDARCACGAPRFKRVNSGGRKRLEPCVYFIGFDIAVS